MIQNDKKKTKCKLQKFNIRAADDFHVHFRQNKALLSYVRDTALHCERALVMPNTQPAISTVEDVCVYKQKIIDMHQKNIKKSKNKLPFTPLMTCKLYSQHTAEDILAFAKAGVVACKLYPQGATTHAEDGVQDVLQLADLYKVMEDIQMVLCIHGEQAQSFVLDREADFLEKLYLIQKIAPQLKIVLEHVSSKKAVEYVKNAADNLVATITVHHLLLTLDDLIGDKLNPHLFCKPVLKYPYDRDALQKVVLEGNKKFFFGTDSAPHIKGQKECALACAGIYTSPVAIALLVDFFEKNSQTDKDGMWIQKLEKFISYYGAQFYNLKLNTSVLEIEHKPWTVPHMIDDVIPMCAGQTLVWKATRLCP